MAAQLVRLKLTLAANGFRRSVWQTIGLVLAVAYAGFLVVLAVVGAVLGGSADPALTGQVVVLLGALVVLGWWVVPLFAFGVDATLDPTRFVTFAIPRRTLLTGLALAGLVSVPAAATALAALGSSLAWRTDLLALAAALVGAVLAVALCVVGSRATTTALAPLLDSRRYREVLGLVAVVLVVLVGPAFGWLSENLSTTVGGAAGGAEAVLAPLVDVVAWTPFGAPWALAPAVHEGAWGLALARLAVSGGALLLAWAVWDRALARALVRPRGGAAAGTGRGLGWFARLPATPTGAVAARAATYWVRDPRYAASLAVVPLMPLLLLFIGFTSGTGGGLLLVAAPLVAWLLGFGVSNDVGYDSTAFALHVATGVPGRADRWGRALPVLVAGTPLVVALACVGCAVADRWDALPAMLGLSVGMLTTSLGVSSAASARMVYPVPKPGESPFKTPQGAAVATMVAQMAAMGVVIALSLPALVLTLAAILLPSPALGWAALVVGVAVGVAVLLLGVGLGARVLERRRPELLQQVMAFR